MAYGKIDFIGRTHFRNNNNNRCTCTELYRPSPDTHSPAAKKGDSIECWWLRESINKINFFYWIRARLLASDQTNSVEVIPFCQMNLWRVRENVPSLNKLREWRDDDYIDNDDAIDNDCCDDVVSSVLSIATEHLLFIYFHFFFLCFCSVLSLFAGGLASVALYSFDGTVTIASFCSCIVVLELLSLALCRCCCVFFFRVWFDSLFCFSVCGCWIVCRVIVRRDCMQFIAQGIWE